jgi:kinesin family protein C2/C3
MEGTPLDRGINYRSLELLFTQLTAISSDYTYEINMSMIEIYNETIYDLLQTLDCTDGSPSPCANDECEIRTGPNGCYVKGISIVNVVTHRDIEKLMNIGYQYRSSSSTLINERSSRSHCILTVNVSLIHKVTQIKLFGKLNLIDLAGSENVQRSAVQGEQLREAQYINRSLSALSDVFAALSKGNVHIPYRNR